MVLLLQKEALDTHEQVERYQGLWGTEFPVKSGSLKYKYNKLADKYDSNLLVKVCTLHLDCLNFRVYVELLRSYLSDSPRQSLPQILEPR